jgi:citrate synthase
MMSDEKRRKLWRSDITTISTDALSTYGVDQREIIRDYSYEEMVFLLLTGRRPTSAERDVLRAVLVSHVSHGITGQSTMAVRAAVDCGSDFLHALIGGLSVGAGQHHQGALTLAMTVLSRYATLTTDELDETLHQQIANGEKISGFGHRYFKRDPRAEELMHVARKAGLEGIHAMTAQRVEAILQQMKGIALNVDGACAALLLDLGIKPAIGHLFIILGRSPMWAAAFLERLGEERQAFPKIEIADLIDVDDDQ